MGKTAIDYAAEANSVKIVAFLMDFGAALPAWTTATATTTRVGRAGGVGCGRRGASRAATSRADAVPPGARRARLPRERAGLDALQAALHGCLKAATAILDAGLHPDMRPITAAPPSELHRTSRVAAGQAGPELTGVVRPGGASGQPSPRARPGQGFGGRRES